MRDFTLPVYRKLLSTLQLQGYQFITFEQWCLNRNIEPPFVILRHDVDLRADRALKMAQLEAAMGVKASYYFRVIPQSNQPAVIRQIAKLGHEIGYHYEDLSIYKGNMDQAKSHFIQQLGYFRQFYDVKTCCMHGSPTSSWDNREIWKNINYAECGIIGEPYLDFIHEEILNRSVFYFTDTARMWDGERFNVRDKVMNSVRSSSGELKMQSRRIHSTFDLIHLLESDEFSGKGMMMTTHPQRWLDDWVGWTSELFIQQVKNILKNAFYVSK